MNPTSRRGTWIVTVGLVAIAAVYLKFIWLPGHRTIKELGKQVETKRSFVAQSTGLSTALMTTQHELEKSKSLVETWKKNAPGRRDIPVLYGDIDALAQNAQLRIERFDPQPFVQHEVLQEIPISISCSGTFAQIYHFLEALEGLPKTIWVESIRLQKQSKDAKDVHGEISLVVFSDNS